MNKSRGLTVLILAGLLAIPLPGGPAGTARAQGPGMTEQQRELQQKRQEQWDYLERLDKEQEDTGARLERARKRREDAQRRQQEAERRLRDSEQQPSRDKTD
jgi:hypothetical protein